MILAVFTRHVSEQCTEGKEERMKKCLICAYKTTRGKKVITAAPFISQGYQNLKRISQAKRPSFLIMLIMF